MSLNEQSIGPLMNAVNAALVKRDLRAEPVSEHKQFSKVSDGFLIWVFNSIDPGEPVDLRYLLFDDDDGATVSISLVMSKQRDVLKEVELWRGDGLPVSRMPQGDELRLVGRGD
jgi:hypothetical protein